MDAMEKMAVFCANYLKSFCENQNNCTDCVFHSETGCVLTPGKDGWSDEYPYKWEVTGDAE